MKRVPLRRIGKRQRARSLRKRLWPEFSRLIRKRDGKCLLLGYGGHRICGGSLQASHIYPKGQYPLLELFPLNVKTLCWGAHLWWHRNPVEARDWFCRRFPQAWRDQLEAVKAGSLSRKGMTESEIRAEWERFGLASA